MNMSTQTQFFRRLALFGYIGLLIWVLLWNFVLTEDQNYSMTFLILFWVLPILLPGPGIIKGKPYTHAWANFIIMIYLMHGLTSLWTEDTEWVYALIEVILATIMFVGCCYYARFRGRELGLGLKKLSEMKEG